MSSMPKLLQCNSPRHNAEPDIFGEVLRGNLSSLRAGSRTYELDEDYGQGRSSEALQQELAKRLAEMRKKLAQA